jgi:hypothetical protein
MVLPGDRNRWVGFSPDFSQGFELRSWRCRQVVTFRVASAAGVLVQYVKVEDAWRVTT